MEERTVFCRYYDTLSKEDTGRISKGSNAYNALHGQDSLNRNWASNALQLVAQSYTMHRLKADVLFAESYDFASLAFQV